MLSYTPSGLFNPFIRRLGKSTRTGSYDVHTTFKCLSVEQNENSSQPDFSHLIVFKAKCVKEIP